MRLVEALLETGQEGSLETRLRAAFPSYEVAEVDGQVTMRLPLTSDGSFEVQVNHAPGEPNHFHVLGDYMSDRTTAAVGLDFVGSFEEVVAQIKSAEEEATLVAQNE